MRAWATVCLVAGVLACSGPRPTHVLLISIDSLRADHLGCYGYPRDTSPRIDALAREGTLFEHAISSTSWTLPAHAALFTGLVDELHGVVKGRLALASGIRTLAERLSQAGYRTGAVVSGPFLHPRFRLYRGFDDYLNCMSYLDEDFRPKQGVRINLHHASHRDATGACVEERARRWLEAQREGPAFLFLHFWDVHYDYAPPPGYAEQFDPDYDGQLDASGYADNPAVSPDMDPRDLEHLIALYDGEIYYTDERVGAVLDALRDLGLAERTLVVLVSDHGDAFFEHGEKGHQKDLHAEVMRIPLILRGPGVPAGLRRPGPAHITDVAPTLLDLLGLPAEGIEGIGAGRSLVPALRAPGALEGRRVYASLRMRGENAEALEDLGLKLIHDRVAGTLLAYDLEADAGEQVPRPATDAERRDLREFVRRLEARRPEFPAAEPVGILNPLVEERLRALGYGD